MDSLEEELVAVDAIYPGCVSRDMHSPRRLIIRPFFDTAESSVACFTLSVPLDYPYAPPSVLGGNGLHQSTLTEILEKVWDSGEVCLYVLIDNLREHKHRVEVGNNISQGSTLRSLSNSSDDDERDEDYQFAISDPIVDRKSTFIGRAISVRSRREAQSALRWLKLQNKKVAKATHNIVAWRLVENGVLMQGNGLKMFTFQSRIRQ